MQIEGSEEAHVGIPVIADINPVFNFEYLSFIFNQYDFENGSAFSWLLRFKDYETEERFQEGLMRALWEQLNEQKWAKAKGQDREYVLEAFNDLTMDDAPQETDEDEFYEYENEDEQQLQDEEGNRSEEYDTDEDEDDKHVHVRNTNDDENENSQLAVGFKHDRSFVVRGDKIGVFKHVGDNGLEFSTTINSVKTPRGRGFVPSKVSSLNQLRSNNNDRHLMRIASR